MNMRRFAVISGLSLLLLAAYTGGCGNGGTGSLTGGGGGGKGVCDGQFGDQGTLCEDCLTKNCAKLFTDCCSSMYCENLANAARGKTCSGDDCYGTYDTPGVLRSLIQDPDFGGVFDVKTPGVPPMTGTPSPAWAAAAPLIACTVAKCVDPATMKQICVK